MLPDDLPPDDTHDTPPNCSEPSGDLPNREDSAAAQQKGRCDPAPETKELPRWVGWTPTNGAPWRVCARIMPPEGRQKRKRLDLRVFKFNERTGMWYPKRFGIRVDMKLAKHVLRLVQVAIDAYEGRVRTLLKPEEVWDEPMEKAQS